MFSARTGRRQISVFDKAKFAVVVAIMVVIGASAAGAQTREFFGPSLPIQFDRYGARHFYVNGYSGPFEPPMPPPAAKAMKERSRRAHASGIATKPKARLVRQ
jgi:hypothetical protein